MDVVGRHNTADNIDTVFTTNTADDFTDAPLDIASKNLEALLCRPDDVITVIENAMLASIIVHDHPLQKYEPQALPGGSYFWRG